MTSRKNPAPHAFPAGSSTTASKPACTPSTTADISEAQAIAELEAHLDNLRSRLEPLVEAIGGKVEIRPLLELVSTPPES